MREKVPNIYEKIKEKFGEIKERGKGKEAVGEEPPKDISEDYQRECEGLTNEYRNNRYFKDLIKELEDIVIKKEFEGILIQKGPYTINAGGFEFSLTKTKDGKTKIATFAEFPKNKISLGEDFSLQYLNEIFNVDRQFFSQNMPEVIEHEKQHSEGRAGNV